MRIVGWLAAAAILFMSAVAFEGCASAPVRRGKEVRFTATAYCDRGITKSGVRTRDGLIAADPDLLPLGSVVRIVDAGDSKYERTYTVMDIGAHIQGRRIDVYIRSCDEARRFGVREVRLQVVRLGRK